MRTVGGDFKEVDAGFDVKNKRQFKTFASIIYDVRNICHCSLSEGHPDKHNFLVRSMCKEDWYEVSLYVAKVYQKNDEEIKAPIDWPFSLKNENPPAK